MDKDTRAGMQTNIWGPGCWIFLHCVATSYPVKITSKNQKIKSQMKRFFTLLGDIFPCKYCRQSYKQFLKSHPIDSHLDSRRSLEKWVYTIHNLVNKKTGKNSKPTFSSVCKQYSSYRADCKENCKRGLKGNSKKCIIKIIANDTELLKSYRETGNRIYIDSLNPETKKCLLKTVLKCKSTNTGDSTRVNDIFKILN